MQKLKELLDQKVEQYNNPSFIEQDPICIPHSFNKLQDIEIAGFFAAILAWGNRKTIINNCKRLLSYMDNTPYDFVCNHSDSDLRPMLGFVHRTFNATDLLWLLHFLKGHYGRFYSLETAFAQFMNPESTDTTEALAGFHNYVFAEPGAPIRTRKHIATPLRHAACKRLNMFLRWMVRKDALPAGGNVDFGLWKTIRPRQLICPLDVHSGNVARRLGLLLRKQDDWKAALELTAALRQFDSEDPVRYDYALFGIGRMERMK
jgi:uncharacterized protein (TIGR02757 family)